MMRIVQWVALLVRRLRGAPASEEPYVWCVEHGPLPVYSICRGYGLNRMYLAGGEKYLKWGSACASWKWGDRRSAERILTRIRAMRARETTDAASLAFIDRELT